MIPRRLLILRRYPRCARLAAGYRCHEYLPRGCEACGRGSPHKYFKGYFGTVKEAEDAYIKLINKLDKEDK